MPVVAVINRKGGSGKSTLATHLAACCAGRGLPVMLGDVDRQQSSLAWLRRRTRQPLARGAAIVGWAVDHKSVMRPPGGVTHVVLDTPGGLRGLNLARVVMVADAILMPVCSSAFDRESTAECYAEVAAQPRVASGRCKVALVGVRLDARTQDAERLQAWAAQHQLPYIGALRDTQAYVRCIDQGLTLFDKPVSKVRVDLAQWQPIIDWVDAAWQAAERWDRAAKAVTRPTTKPTTKPTTPSSSAHSPAPTSASARPSVLGNAENNTRPASPRLPPLPAYRTSVAVSLASAERDSATRPTRRSLGERIGRLFALFRSSR